MLYATHVPPQCHNNEATVALTIIYNEVESDTRNLCDDCEKLFRRDARRHGYKIRSKRLSKLCPRCGEPLVPMFFLGEILDFLDCENCKIAYDPETLKPLAHIV
jgi:protein-arginine kinase activator protein McsA